jgi:hypothetical protein
MLGSGGASKDSSGRTLDFGSSDFQNTVIGEAVSSAVKQTTAQLVADESKLPRPSILVEGLVAAVDANTIVLNIGSRAGLHVGDELAVARVAKEIRDPATGKTIAETTSPIGVIKVAEVDEASASASPVSGSDFKVGDRVKIEIHR